MPWQNTDVRARFAGIHALSVWEELLPISPFLLPSITAPVPFTLQSITLLQFDCFCNFTHVGRKHGNGKIAVLRNLEVWRSRKSQKYVRYDHIRIKSGIKKAYNFPDKLGPKQTKNPSLRNEDKVSFGATPLQTSFGNHLLHICICNLRFDQGGEFWRPSNCIQPTLNTIFKISLSQHFEKLTAKF